MAFTATLSANSSSIYPPLESMAEKIAKEVAKCDKITSAKILAGFDYVFNGKEYHFSYKLDDQLNFSQMNTSATLAIQLDAMDDDAINASYPGYKTADGLTHPEILPAPRARDYQIQWQGHADGTSHTLIMTPQQFLELAKAGGAHNQMLLGAGWIIKNQLRACKDEAELKAKVKELQLDEQLRDLQ